MLAHQVHQTNQSTNYRILTKTGKSILYTNLSNVPHLYRKSLISKDSNSLISNYVILNLVECVWGEGSSGVVDVCVRSGLVGVRALL